MNFLAKIIVKIQTRPLTHAFTIDGAGTLSSLSKDYGMLRMVFIQEEKVLVTSEDSEKTIDTGENYPNVGRSDPRNEWEHRNKRGEEPVEDEAQKDPSEYQNEEEEIERK